MVVLSVDSKLRLPGVFHFALTQLSSRGKVTTVELGWWTAKIWGCWAVWQQLATGNGWLGTIQWQVNHWSLGWRVAGNRVGWFFNYYMQHSAKPKRIYILLCTSGNFLQNWLWIWTQSKSQQIQENWNSYLHPIRPQWIEAGYQQHQKAHKFIETE